MWDSPGHDIALDFLYSRRHRRGADVDLLAEPADLRAWLEDQAGRLPEVPDAALERDFASWYALRDAIGAALAAAVAGERLPPEALAEINRRAAAEPVAPKLTTTGSSDLAPIAAVDPSVAAQARIARSAIEILGTDKRPRLRFCTPPGCGVYYLANRPQQRWCSPQCGTRTRVARHAARSRPER